ncbi:hypothetical protein BACCIP111883_01246 [Sutcliffiella rhizosphaerae]|uniref:Uncharacterized protein n=1 Tax=Sutcliffiella rhizosphaerae TaxID=2880967 RepID=A0ABN8ABG0_9BACI|nr:hypothetical protein BACCIP111883_01246 [Sutcliffiella rhizosphaerae]
MNLYRGELISVDHMEVLSTIHCYEKEDLVARRYYFW